MGHKGENKRHSKKFLANCSAKEYKKYQNCTINKQWKPNRTVSTKQLIQKYKTLPKAYKHTTDPKYAKYVKY